MFVCRADFAALLVLSMIVCIQPALANYCVNEGVAISESVNTELVDYTAW